MEQQRTVLSNDGVQTLIRTLVNDTVAEKNRTVSIRIDPDGAISISVYPLVDDE